MVELIRRVPDEILYGEQMPRLWTVPPRHAERDPGCRTCDILDLRWGTQFTEEFAPGTPAGCGQYIAMDCLAWAKGVGYDLYPWQKWVLLNSMGVKYNAKWAARQAALIISRQNGKGTVLEVRELYGLFVMREHLIIHTAHELKTSKEHFLRIITAIENSPSLSSKLKGKPRLTNGQEQIELKSEPTLIMGPNGSRVRKREAPRLLFVARSRGSARGFTADLLVYDEAMILSTESVGASLPTLSTLPNPQVWFTGSAGMEDSFQLARLHNQIAKGSKKIFGAEWSAQLHKETCPRDDRKGRPDNNYIVCEDPAHMDRDDPKTWAVANPTMGHRISEEHIRETELDTMDPKEFDRERLGVGQWPAEEAAWAVIAEDLWETLVVRPPKAQDRKGAQVGFGVDVDPDGRIATVSIAWIHKGKMLIEIPPKWSRPGTGWVVDFMKQMDRKYRPACIVVPRSGAAAGLGDDIEKMWPDNPKWGTKVVRATVADEAAAFAWFTQQCKNKERPLVHLSQDHNPSLYTAVGTAETRVVGDGGKAWSRRDSDSDITQITSPTLASWGLNKKRRNYDVTKGIA